MSSLPAYCKHARKAILQQLPESCVKFLCTATKCALEECALEGMHDLHAELLIQRNHQPRTASPVQFSQVFCVSTAHSLYLAHLARHQEGLHVTASKGILSQKIVSVRKWLGSSFWLSHASELCSTVALQLCVKSPHGAKLCSMSAVVAYI